MIRWEDIRKKAFISYKIMVLKVYRSLNKSCIYIFHVFCQASLLVRHLEWHAHYLLGCSSLRLREYERRNNNRGIFFFGKEEMREYQVCLSFASPKH